MNIPVLRCETIMCGLKKQMRVFDVELIESCRNAQICDESMYMVTAECPGDHPPAGVGLREKTEGAFVRGRGRVAAKGMRGTVPSSKHSLRTFISIHRKTAFSIQCHLHAAEGRFELLKSLRDVLGLTQTKRKKKRKECGASCVREPISINRNICHNITRRTMKCKRIFPLFFKSSGDGRAIGMLCGEWGAGRKKAQSCGRRNPSTRSASRSAGDMGRSA